MEEEKLDELLPDSAAEAEAQEPIPEQDVLTEPPVEEEPVDYEQLAAEDLAEIKRLDPSYAPASVTPKCKG